MRLSTRSTYGMRALVELGLAAGLGPLSASLIARRQSLSVAYLEQLLHRLKKHGLVCSVRGPRGGYALTRNPHEVTMAEVVGILDGANGAWNGNGVSDVKSDGRNRAGHNRTCARDRNINAGASRLRTESEDRHARVIAKTIRRLVHERLTQALDAISLQDLCDAVQKDAEPLGHRYVFHI